jgi:hypothetical protein
MELLAVLAELAHGSAVEEDIVIWHDCILAAVILAGDGGGTIVFGADPEGVRGFAGGLLSRRGAQDARDGRA